MAFSCDVPHPFQYLPILGGYHDPELALPVSPHRRKPDLLREDVTAPGDLVLVAAQDLAPGGVMPRLDDLDRRHLAAITVVICFLMHESDLSPLEKAASGASPTLAAQAPHACSRQQGLCARPASYFPPSGWSTDGLPGISIPAFIAPPRSSSWLLRTPRKLPRLFRSP